MSHEVREVAPAPSVRAAAAVFVGYCVVVVGLMRLSGVDYEHFFDSAGSTLRSAVLPLAAGAVLLGVVLRATGWSVLRDRSRLRMGVLWALPGLMVVIVGVQLLGLSWGDLGLGHVAAVVLAAVLVGITEETLFRGIILTALRARTGSEAAAAGLTTLWFGLFHLTNLLLSEPGAVLQVLFAALSGLGFYLARRGTGTIVAAMALHGAWDLSAFLAGVAPGDGALGDVASFLVALLYPLAVVVLGVLLVRDRSTPPPTGAPGRTGSATG
jgi:hypothetical protein